MEKKDEELKNNIINQLNWDLRIEASTVKVAVKKRIVSLSGFVPTYPMQLAIHKHIWLVPGVRGLRDNTTIDLGDQKNKNDSDLNLLIKKILLWLPNIDAIKIKVEVSQSWATLSGCVESYSKKCQVEKIISTVPGIKGVTSALLVAAPKKLSDDKILNNLLSFLKNKIGANLNSVKIKVNKGIVNVSGTASNLKDYQIILGAIIFTQGVVSIIEKISVAQ